MLAYQSSLPLTRAVPARVRSVRRSFHPSQKLGPYRLPNEVRDRLTASLAPYRNREAAFALAVFLARFWSVPVRVIGSFPVDRRELANRDDLGLTEAKVRGAICVLEEIGFIGRAIVPSGSRYKQTEDGLHRKPILFMFGAEYAPAFIKANNRAAAARGGRSGERRTIPAEAARGLSITVPVASSLNSPKSKSEADKTVIMGEIRKPTGLPPSVSEQNPKLEAALDRLWQGFRHSRGS